MTRGRRISIVLLSSASVLTAVGLLLSLLSARAQNQAPDAGPGRKLTTQAPDAGPGRKLTQAQTARCIADTVSSTTMFAGCLCSGKDDKDKNVDPAAAAAAERCFSNTLAFQKLVEERCGFAGAFGGDRKAACDFRLNLIFQWTSICRGYHQGAPGYFDGTDSWLSKNDRQSLTEPCVKMLLKQVATYKSECDPSFTLAQSSPTESRFAEKDTLSPSNQRSSAQAQPSMPGPKRQMLSALVCGSR